MRFTIDLFRDSDAQVELDLAYDERAQM